MKQIRGKFLVVWVFPVFIILILSVLIPVRGWSQQEPKKHQVASGEFSLSQEVHWENSVLPMGDYIYYVDSSRWPAVVSVQQKDGSFSGIFVPMILLRPGTENRSGIVVAKVGDESYVKTLYLRDGQGELSFSIPEAKSENQPASLTSAKETSATFTRAAEYLTIFNPNHDKISFEEVEKVYLGACEAVEKEYNRPVSIRPRLILRLGADNNVLRYPMREIQLKKWDGYRFADAVVELALHDMVSHEDRARLSNTAVNAAGATVSVCELKACVN